MEKWQNPEILALWFGLILLFILILVSVILLLIRMNYRKILSQRKKETEVKIQHQQALLTTTIQTQEKERKRIASDLHDGLIGSLVSIRLEHQIKHPSSAISERIADSIQNARRISHDLSPPMVEFSTIDDILLNIITPWKSKFDIEFTPFIFHSEHRSDEFKTQVIRIFQEVLTNIDKHANAEKIVVNLRKTSSSFFLSIYDNGDGMKSNGKKGLGLSNLESRTQYLNGKMKIKSELGSHTGFLFLFSF